MRYELVTAPADQPVALDVAKSHLRVDTSDDDELIIDLISAGTKLFEDYTGLALISQQWDFWLDEWPPQGFFPGGPTSMSRFTTALRRDVLLPKYPVKSIDVVNVYAKDGTSSTYSSSNYRLDTAEGRMVLLDSSAPPLPTRSIDGIQIRFTAGYDSALAVPAVYKRAILEWVAMAYEHRGDQSTSPFIPPSWGIHVRTDRLFEL